MIIFKQRLKELREDKGISQKELANTLNLRQQSISMWENGSRQPNYDMLETLCKYFEVTADYLLGLSDY